MTFSELIAEFDFDFVKHPDGYGLVDLQGANLANIEDERFENPLDMVGRLVNGVYGDDYLFSDGALEDAGCKNVEEYIAGPGNDENNEFLYYALHPDKLTEIPEELPGITKVYYTAREKAEKELDSMIKAGRYPFYELVGSDCSETPHYLKAVCFSTETELQDWVDGKFENGSHAHGVTILVDKFFDTESEHDIVDEEERG